MNDAIGEMASPSAYVSGFGGACVGLTKFAPLYREFDIPIRPSSDRDEPTMTANKSVTRALLIQQVLSDEIPLATAN